MSEVEAEKRNDVGFFFYIKISFKKFERKKLIEAPFSQNMNE